MVELFRHQTQKYLVEKMYDCSSIDAHMLHASKRKQLFIKEKIVVDDEEYYVNNYGNQLCNVSRNYSTIVVESNEDKVSLKIFSGYRIRGAGKVFFKKKNDLMYLTFSKKTGDLYFGTLKNYNSKTKKIKTIQKNIFHFNIVGTLTQYWRAKNILDVHEDNTQIINKAFGIFSEEVLGKDWQLNYGVFFNNNILKRHLEVKKVKFPNNFYVFYSDYTKKVSLKHIRKSKNKLVDAFMVYNELKGDSIKKVLHEVSSINVPILKLAYFLFPEEWVNQDPDMIKKCLEFDSGLTIWSNNYMGIMTDVEDLNMTKTELKRVFITFKEILTYHVNLNSFIDHIYFYLELKKLGETDIKWMCKDRKTFNDEHFDFTEKIDYHKKGLYYRVYPEYMKNHIENPFSVNDYEYYPKLLDSTETYVNESVVQSNCVKTYIGTSSSYIISIRKNKIESEERATVEFKVFKNNDKITFSLVQKLGRFNEKLTELWEPVIREITTRFEKCVKDKRFETVKLKKVFKSGKVLESDSYFDKDGNHRWNSVDITNYYQ